MSVSPANQSQTSIAGDAGSPYRIAIIGIGARSNIAFNAVEVRPGTTIVAAADIAPEGRARARKQFGDIPVYENIDELIAAGGFDACIVTTGDDSHAEIAVKLLRAGIPSYIEKPLAITLEDADAVLTAAAETKTPLYIGHNMRHSDVAQAMRAIIERGEIGEIKAVWVRHFVGNGGDYYFKDWHADRSKVGTLLLQKASHDLDIVHYLAKGYSRRVVGMGDLMIYGGITERKDRRDEIMPDWFSYDNWPPAQTGAVNPVVDVEDVSHLMSTLDNGVQVTYQQCHFTPDYWRNYTFIGTEGRLENFGDTSGGVIRVWNKRHEWQLAGDVEYPIKGVTSGHHDADLATMREFLNHAIDGAPTVVSPIAAREAVAAGAKAAESLRNGSRPIDIPELPPHVLAHFQGIAI